MSKLIGSPLKGLAPELEGSLPRSAAGGDRTLQRNLALLDALTACSLGPSHDVRLEPHPGKAHPAPQLQEARLNQRVRPVLKVWQLHEEGVSGSTWRAASEAGAAFRRYAFHSKRVWEDMKRRGHSVAYESIEYLLDLTTRPGARLIEVLAVPLRQTNVPGAEHGLEGLPLAYGLINVDPEPDLLPPEYRGRSDIARGQEIFAVNPSKSMLFREGFLVDMVLDEAVKLAGGKTILTKIVVAPREHAYIWSQRALTARGFVPAGCACAEYVVLPAVPGIREQARFIKLVSEWFVREPGAVTNAQLRREARIAEERRWVMERIAPAVQFPAGDARLIFWSVGRGDNEAYLFAGQQARNAVIAAELKPSAVYPHRENLRYIAGTPDGAALPAESVDGSFLLNVLPEVAVRGRHAPLENVREFLANQAAQLTNGGLLLVRDFVLPDWPEQVVIRAPATDGKAAGSLRELSSAAFFESYLGHAYAGKGVQAEPAASDDPDVACWRVSREEAFKLRHLNAWRRHAEIPEIDLQLGLGTQVDYLRVAREDLNCRVRMCRPIYTPRVMEELRSQGITVHDEAGRELEEPPNQMELVLEKVRPGEGVLVKEIAAERINNASYLTSRFFVRERDGEMRQLIARRGNEVYFPYVTYEVGGEVWVLAREGYPRPIPRAMYGKVGAGGQGRDYSLSGTVSSGYEIEAVAAVRERHESRGAAIARCLRERARLPEENIPAVADLDARDALLTLPSPSTVDEQQFSLVVDVPPTAHMQAMEGGQSGLSSSGRVRPFRLADIIDVADSSPIAGMQLATMAYRELLRRGKPIPRWNGEPVVLRDQSDPGINVVSAAGLFLAQPLRFSPQWREVAAPPGEKYFYEVWRGTFAEQNGDGELIAHPDGSAITIDLEYAVPAERLGLTNNTIPFLMVMKCGERVLVGFEQRDDLPVVEQLFSRATLPCSFAFRIPYDLPDRSRRGAEHYALSKLEKEARVRVLRHWSLGPELSVSNGLLAERSYPGLVEVDAASAKDSGAVFCDLEDCLRHNALIHCGHTLTTLFRAAHALGRLK